MPTTLPIDLTDLVAVFMGSLMVLIPVAGLTARFAMKPIVESLAKLRDAGGAAEALEMVERRLSLLEQEVQSVSNVRDEVARLADELEFKRKLAEPRKRATEE